MKANAAKSSMSEIYQLPSKGILYPQYGEGYNGEVTVRSMTTFEEKNRLGSQGFWKTMTGILDAVTIAPEGFDSESLTQFDFYYLMYKMRTVSYGPTYKVSLTCPHCGKTMTSEVNLDDIPVTYLPDDFKEPFEIGPLPRSGDTLGCRFLRVHDSVVNERKAKEILRDYPDYIGDPEYILTRASQIVSINGEETSAPQAKLYVENMLAMDSAYLSQAYNKIVDGYGMNTLCHDVCKSCGEEFEFALPFNSEFFRPTFDF